MASYIIISDNNNRDSPIGSFGSIESITSSNSHSLPLLASRIRILIDGVVYLEASTDIQKEMVLSAFDSNYHR